MSRLKNPRLCHGVVKASPSGENVKAPMHITSHTKFQLPL